MKLSMTDKNRDSLALLLLRLGLGWFLLVWAVNKFLAPGQYEKIWGYFYGIEIGPAMPYVFGALQALIAIAMILGIGRIISYGLGFLLHGVTVVVILPALLAPFVIEKGFPVNRNNAVAVAVLGGLAALWLLRHRDHWSLDVWLAKRRGHAPSATSSA